MGSCGILWGNGRPLPRAPTPPPGHALGMKPPASARRAPSLALGGCAHASLTSSRSSRACRILRQHPRPPNTRGLIPAPREDWPSGHRVGFRGGRGVGRTGPRGLAPVVATRLHVLANWDAEAREIQASIAALRGRLAKVHDGADGEPEDLRARSTALGLAWRSLQDFRAANAAARDRTYPQRREKE